jgi:hypothetical protein
VGVAVVENQCCRVSSFQSLVGRVWLCYVPLIKIFCKVLLLATPSRSPSTRKCCPRESGGVVCSQPLVFVSHGLSVSKEIQQWSEIATVCDRLRRVSCKLNGGLLQQSSRLKPPQNGKPARQTWTSQIGWKRIVGDSRDFQESTRSVFVTYLNFYGEFSDWH